MEYPKDYDITMIYHMEKANIVANVLSRKFESMSSLAYMKATRHLLCREIQTLANNFLRRKISDRGGLSACVEVRSLFFNQVKAKQLKDENLRKICDKLL